MKTINCPNCNNEAISVDDWSYKWAKNEDCIMYFACKSCKSKLGSLPTMTGLVEVIVWDKLTEIK